MTKQELLTRENIRNHYGKYYDNNDEAHKLNHADDVVDLMITMNERLNLNVDLEYIYLSGYIHDMFADRRKEHNQLAYQYVITYEHCIILNSLNMFERGIIAKAVFEHRASFKGIYSNILSELLASADRGRPSLKDSVIRAYLYRSDETYDIAINETLNHLKDKFGSRGYVRYPELYRKYFEVELNEFNRGVDSLTINKVKNIIEGYKNGGL